LAPVSVLSCATPPVVSDEYVGQAPVRVALKPGNDRSGVARVNHGAALGGIVL
jgi:hypothetical protein